MLERLIEYLLGAAFDAGAGMVRRIAESSSGKSAPAPKAAALPPTDAPIVIGETIFGGLREKLARRGRTGSDVLPPGSPVSVTIEELTRHALMIGKSGSGKTTAQIAFFLADVDAKRGVALIDYRGDLVDRALLLLAARYAPEEISERLLILDVRERSPYRSAGEPVVCFRPLLECGTDPYAAAFFIMDILRQQWGDLGTQMAETLRNGLLALSLTGWSLMEMEPLLTVPRFRREVMAKITDTTVLRFFERFDALGSAGQAAWTLPVLNKLSVYFSMPHLRTVLGQRADQEGVVGAMPSLRSAIDSRPDIILLVCLGADELFKQTAGLVGNMVTAAIARAVMRSDGDGVARRKRSLRMILDEFQNTAIASAEMFEEILAEGRRFGLSTVVSHQSCEQIPTKLRLIIRNIAATHLYFAVGGSDADTLAGELPSEEPKAMLRSLLANQPVGHALLMRQGKPLVCIRTRHSPDPQDVQIAKVIALRRASMERWGIPKSDAEARIAERERLYSSDEGPNPADAFPDEEEKFEVRDAPPSDKSETKRRAAPAGKKK